MLDKSIAKNILASCFIQVVNYVAPFLVFPYLSRVLDIGSFGLLSLLLSICSISKIITDYGFDLSATHWIAKNKESKYEVSNYIINILYVKTILLLLVLSFLIFYVCTFNNSFMPKGKYDIWIGIACVITSQTYQFSWFFNGIEKMKNIAYATLYSKLVYVILVFVFVKNKNDMDVCLFCYALSNLVMAVVSIYQIFKSGFTISFNKNQIYINALFKDSWYFFLSRASVGLYTTACTFFVGTFAGIQQAALYSSAEKLYQAGKSATAPVSQAIFPYISRTSDYKQFLKCIFIFLIPVSVGSVFVFVFSKDILNLVFGLDYIAATNVLKCFVVCLVVSFLSVMLGYPAFSLFNRLDLANKSVIFSSFIQVFIIAILVYKADLSAFNISLSVLLAESVTLLVRILLLISLFMSNKKC